MSKSKGIFLVILSASSFGLIPLFAKTAYANDFNPYTFSLFRSLFASIELYIFLKIKDLDFNIEKQQYFTMFKTSLFGYCFMMLTLFSSYNYMATGLATTLHFIYPVVVMVGSIVFYKQKIGWKKILVLIISLIGIYFLVGFESSKSLSVIGVTLALISGIFYGYYILMISYTNIKTINPFVLTFYISLFNTVILLVMSIITGKFNLNVGIKGILSCIMVALVCNMVGMSSLQKGVRVINPTTAAILSTFEPITSLVIGIILLNELLLWHQIIGSILILISVIIASIIESKEKVNIKEKVEN